jgi:hypothetical protein
VMAESAAIEGQIVVPFAVDPYGDMVPAAPASDIEGPGDPGGRIQRVQIIGVPGITVEGRADACTIDSDNDDSQSNNLASCRTGFLLRLIHQSNIS